MQSPPSPIAFSIGAVDIHYYGLFMFTAIMVALLVIRFVAKRYYKNIDTDIILDILPAIILSSIIGARLYYVLLDINYFSQNWSEIFAVWHGGMSIHGGIIGGILTGLVLAKIKKISFLCYADVFSYGLVLGQAIGRFGNWFNCEAFGKPCTIPFLKLFIPEQNRPYGYEQYQYFHPTFLYESLWNIIVFCILFFIIRNFTNIKSGTIFFSYLILYSIGRFFIEFCRIDSVLNLADIHIAHIVSIIVIILSVIALLKIYRTPNIQ